MRWWAPLWFAAIFCTGCARCASKVEFESFVTVPTELDAVEELDDPPDVVVKVEKKAAPKGGGGGCGHSPLCIIIIPFAIADALFPEKLRIASVSEKGRETYHGVFRENGQFVQALAFQDGVWKKIALLELPELGRNLVVEIAHAPPDAEGKPGNFDWSSLQKQVDVLSGYRARFGGTTDAEQKSRLMREMLERARTDALPLARERLLDGAESPLVKQTALAHICSGKTPLGSPEERKSLMQELDAKSPDTATSSAALACFDPKEPQAASAFTARILDAACAEKTSDRAQALAEKVLSWAAGADVRGAIEPFVTRCAARERRQFLRYLLRFELDRTELGELAASKDVGVAATVISRLDNENETHRSILLAELERPDAPTGALLSALSKNGKQPDAAEAKALAGAFIALAKKPNTRAELLLRLGTTPEDQQKDAKARLEQKLATESGAERAALHAGLVALGDHEREAGALRALHGHCSTLAEARTKPAPSSSATPAPSASSKPERSPLELAESECTRKLPQHYWQVHDTPELVAFVLQQAGCSERELMDIAATAPNPKAPERGRVCRGD